MGTEVLTLGLAKGLVLRGHTTEVLTGHPEYNISHKDAPWITTDQYEGITVNRLHFGLSKWKANRYFAMHEPARISLIKTLVHKLNPDIVHFNHLIGLTTEVIPMLRNMDIPVFFTPTDFWTICPRFTLYNAYTRSICADNDNPIDCLQCMKPMPRSLIKALYRIAQTDFRKLHWKMNLINQLACRTKIIMGHINQCNKMFVSTQFLKNILVKHGADGLLIEVLPYGANIGVLPEQLPIPTQFTEKEPLRLCFIGTLSNYKSPHTLVDALSYMGKMAKNVSISIYGDYIKNDSYRQVLSRRLKGTEGIVELKGTFPNESIGGILRSHHCLIVPSIWYESSPLVLISALNARLPIIVSDLGGLTEAIHEGNFGFSYASGNPEKLAEVVLNIMKNPRILLELRNNLSGYRRTTEDYVNEIEKRYLAVTSKRVRSNVQ
jgi:glycosyltransferase involved in cell wall biosynthesis